METLKGNKLFLLLLLIFICTPLMYFSFVPFWDGWEFTNVCYKPTAKKLFVSCFNHSAIFNDLLFGSTQMVDYGNVLLIYILNILIGVLGIVSFYYLLGYLFGKRLSEAEKAVGSFLFGLNPVFLAHLIQPTLDFALPVYISMLLLFLFTRRYVFAALFGLMLSFTKETGFMAYGVIMVLYVIIYLKPKEILRRAYLFLPILIFILYTMFFPLHAERGGSFPGLLREMFSLNVTSGFFKSQFASAFMMNFYWVLLLMIVFSVIFHIINMDRRVIHKGFKDGTLRIFFFVIMVLMTWFLTRVEFVNNARYMLPVLPVFVILAIDSVLLFRDRIVRLALLTVPLVLIYASSFTTFDPVSISVFSTFDFGEHRMLKMNRFFELGENHGRDEIVYNFQFTELHYLTEMIVARNGIEKTYVADKSFTWTDFSDFRHFSNKAVKRTARDSDIYNVSFFTPDQAISKNDRTIYYIDYPNIKNHGELDKLLLYYSIVRNRSFDHYGYSIDVLQMESMMP